MIRTAFLTDSRGQSEVTGTILLVAIAIVLGAVVGGYVFNVTQNESTVTPQASFTYDYDESAEELTITHDSGDKFESANVKFVKKEGSGSINELDSWPTEVTSGDSTKLGNIKPGDVILVVWEEPAQQGKTSVLDEWEGPEA